jgi:hemerythrin-like metal-binding protein
MKFTWTDTYSVHIKEIDEQHQHFFELVNEIDDIVKTQQAGDRDVLMRKVEELGDYAFYHLSTEEQLFKKYGYPEARVHIDFHNLYRDKMADFITEVHNPTANLFSLAGELSDFSGSWLKNHIITVDQKYSAFFKEHGVD